MRQMREMISEIMARLRGEYTLKRLLKLGLKVGKGFHMERGCIIDQSHCWLIHIGDDVILAPRVHILAHDTSTKLFVGYTKIGRVEIGSRVFIGAGSIILPNVKIGNNVVIGAGSIVSRDIPNDSVACGSPCRVISPIQEFVDKNKVLMEQGPVYDETWTLRKKVDKYKKSEMDKALERGCGFVE